MYVCTLSLISLFFNIIIKEVQKKKKGKIPHPFALAYPEARQDIYTQSPTLGHLFFEPFTVRLCDRLWGTDPTLKRTTLLWQG